MDHVKLRRCSDIGVVLARRRVGGSPLFNRDQNPPPSCPPPFSVAPFRIFIFSPHSSLISRPYVSFRLDSRNTGMHYVALLAGRVCRYLCRVHSRVYIRVRVKAQRAPALCTKYIALHKVSVNGRQLISGRWAPQVL